MGDAKDATARRVVCGQEVIRTPSPRDGACPACGEPIAEGEPIAPIRIGPGADPEQRFKARRGWAYDSAGIAVHWACATGEEGEEFGPLGLDNPIARNTRAIDDLTAALRSQAE